MKTRSLVAATAISLLLATPSLAAEKLYFADNGNDKILRCDLDGTNLEELVTTGIVNVGDIAIDRTGGKMYWTDWPTAGSTIKRANLDGTGVETLLSGLSGPWGIALDVAGGKMYWTEFSSDVIRRANLDGTGVEDLITTGLVDPSGIALDLADGRMYFAVGATEFTAAIKRAYLNGTYVQTVVDDPLVAPEDIDLDPIGGKIYWSDLGTDSWWRADLDGSDLEEILLSDYGTPIGCVLEPTTSKLFVSEYGGSDSVIKRCNLDGTGVEVVLESGVGAIYGLTLGPETPECSNASFADVWLVLVTGYEVYDYAIWITPDGLGTITEMGDFHVPVPAGTYAVEADCDMTGTIWVEDAYVPFTGRIHDETSAELDIGDGPLQLVKVTDVGALMGCWQGWFLQDVTGTLWNVTMHIAVDGVILASTGFPGPVEGRIYTESEHLAGRFALGFPGAPQDVIVFQEASCVGNAVMSGDYGMDCSEPCNGGIFNLARCTTTGLRNETPGRPAAELWCYPNPFNPRTTIAFDLRDPGLVSLRVFDASGHLVTVLRDSELFARGRHEVVWSGRDAAGRPVPSGPYFFRLEGDGFGATRRAMLIR